MMLELFLYFLPIANKDRFHINHTLQIIATHK